MWTKRESLLAAGILMCAWTFVAPKSSRQITLAPLSLELTAVDDSSTYLLYRYDVRNPASSNAGVEGFDLDISATSDMPYASPNGTGKFKVANLILPERRVPLGPMIPAGWRAIVDTRIAVFDTVYAWLTSDSIAPGSSLQGFGLRSVVLPGVRVVDSYPTVQSCCTIPDPNSCDDPTEESCIFPLPSRFVVKAFGVGPTYDPATFDLSTLESQKIQVCTTLSWITDSGTCAKLQQRLEFAGAALGSSNYPVARAQLDAFVTELEARHHATQTLNVNHNAYWMLSTNAKHIRFKSLPPAACQTITPLKFAADQTLNGGEIRIRNGEINLIIDLVMASGWTLVESHVAVDHDLSGIPQGNVGGLQYGAFPYSAQHPPGTASYTYVIPLSSLGASANTRLFLAVHGNVKQGTTDREAWADGTRTLPTGTDWGMYFTYTVTSC